MNKMRTSVEITNLTKKRINPGFVRKIVKKTMQATGTKLGFFEISLVFASRAEIRKINRIYRKYDKSTDVLSFNYSSRYNKKGDRNISSEIIICPEMIEKSAEENKISFKQELAFVLSHGVLHILGFRHGRKMYYIQDEVSQNL